MSSARFKQAFADERQYDSDEDLTPSERSTIRGSMNEDKARDRVWENKPLTDRFTKTMKSIWYGDKRDKGY